MMRPQRAWGGAIFAALILPIPGTRDFLHKGEIVKIRPRSLTPETDGLLV
jgi:hypothetical protein